MDGKYKRVYGIMVVMHECPATKLAKWPLRMTHKWEFEFNKEEAVLYCTHFPVWQPVANVIITNNDPRAITGCMHYSEY